MRLSRDTILGNMFAEAVGDDGAAESTVGLFNEMANVGLMQEIVLVPTMGLGL